jgi:hypothetical protein
MSARSTAGVWVAALGAVVALAGCGSAPPAAPIKQAKKLDASTSDIATECGLSYQVKAFPGEHRKDLANLESQATTSARSLASVDNLDPKWIYQGEAVSEIVSDALSMLKSCGLTRAERTLRRATSHGRS